MKKYPNLNLIYDNKNKNYFIIKDYCIHKDIRIYCKIFNKLYKDNKCLCIECKKEIFKSYIPSNEEILNFQNEFQQFYYKHALSFNEKWFLINFPKEYKIIFEWSKHLNISLKERIYLFKNKLKEIPICSNINCTNKVSFNKSQLVYNKFCKSYSCVKNISSIEIEIFKYIKSINKSTKLKHYINGTEYDIIVKNKNLLIEVNGLYWHGDLIKKDKNYHYKKSKLAIDNKYNLFNIWEDDWKYKQDIIKSILIDKVNKQQIKINARDCIIKEVKNTKEFLNNNHIEGWCKSSINLGLYYNDELVSLMIFRKRKNCQYELIRFCNKINIDVKDSTIKLFKYFLSNYNNTNIIGYLDYSNINLYKQLGFNNIKQCKINYWWCDNDKRYNKSNFTKYKLIKEGFDPNKTENEIMRERKFYKIWDTGNILFEYKK